MDTSTPAHSVKLNLSRSPVPKGEVWLGTDFLAKAGFQDTLDHHLKMADQLGQDIICFPVALNTNSKPPLGYRYFTPADIRAAADSSRFIAAAVDGPFQELVNQKGLMAVLTGWISDRDALQDAYAAEQEKTMALIQESMENGADAIIIMDDLSGDQGPMISPDDIDMMCSGFYEAAANRVHGADRLVLLHCCGKITGLARVIGKWQLDGFAAVQHQANDLVLLQSLFPSCILMAGIDGNLLEGPLTDAAQDEFRTLTQQLLKTGRFILSSACGLYSGTFFERIQHLYKIADQQI